jgi:hypothetical protein
MWTGPIPVQKSLGLDWTKPGPVQSGLVHPRTGGIIGEYVHIRTWTIIYMGLVALLDSTMKLFDHYWAANVDISHDCVLGMIYDVDWSFSNRKY